MNRDNRRDMRKRTVARVKKARAFITVTFDGEGEPVYSFDINFCGDQKDARHILMHAIANFVEKQSATLREEAMKRIAQFEQKAAVEEAKEKRSLELATA